MNDVGQSLRKLIGVFDRLSLPYAVMGGIAVRAYGIPRPTFDVDFALLTPRSKLGELYKEVEVEGYTVPEAYRAGWVDEIAGMPLVKFRMFLAGHGVDVDVFIVESPFQQELIHRRRLVETEDGNVWLVSPEDLILLKLLAYRPRDVADILDVFFTQGQLDERYLRHWAAQLHVIDRLNEVLAQTDNLT
jgi:hypothetical protein